MVGAYIALTKPRIIELLLITTVPTMVLAERGWPSWSLVAVTLVGGTLAAGGANAVNMYVDRDIDALMERTQGRPLVTGVIPARNALMFADRAAGPAFAVLWAGANLLSAVLAFSGAAFYVGVYTLWLKRTSRQNIVIGGAAGAVPVLVGWAAVQDSLAWTPVVLFVAMFLWTPPHFWALAVKYADDYRAADVPMLPTVVPIESAVRQMFWYTVALVITTLVLIPVADSAGSTGCRRRPRRHVHRRHRRPAPSPHAGRQHAALRFLDHLRHRALRSHDTGCPRPVRLVTAAIRSAIAGARPARISGAPVPCK